MISIYSISLGCPKNRVDTERALGGLGPVRAVDTPKKADLVFVNTCGFIAPAVEESVRTLVSLVHETAALRRRPLLAVAGCLVGRYTAAALAEDLPEVDLWLDVDDPASWSGRILAALSPRGFASSAPGGRLLSTGPSYAWLKISDGCRHACAFCTIPSIRGPLRSTAAGVLVEEARLILDAGVKELVLVAQDVSAWGRDKGDGLKRLLEKLLPLPGLARLRLMYLYPSGLTDSLLGFLRAAGAPFVPYFDIPLQHAASGVLSRMGRPFARNPRVVIERVRKHFPEAALRTSLIVGFPGETDKDFETLCDFVREARFHHLGVFAYQAEEGTPAATMPDQLPDRVKQWRRDVIMEIQAEISAEILTGYVGGRETVLVDAPHPEWPGLFTGRTWFQAPEVDGTTYISGPGVEAGALVEADIVEASDYDLTALTDAEES